MSYIYLASPYSNPSVLTRRHRHLQAENAVHWMLSNKLWVYSPIVHCHFLAEGYQLPQGGDFWLPYNKAMLRSACALWILDIEGTDQSNGIKEEIEAAEEFGLPIGYLKPTAPGVYEHPSIPEEILHASPI
jgi:hypothetical protein